MFKCKLYSAKKVCKKIRLTDQNLIEIKSNCLFLRPTIFCYKDDYLDIHHS